MATRSTVTIIAASLAIGIAASLGIGKLTFSPEPTPDAFMVQCVSVYDGDTISVEYRGNVEKVRLLGVGSQPSYSGQAFNNRLYVW